MPASFSIKKGLMVSAIKNFIISYIVFPVVVIALLLALILEKNASYQRIKRMLDG
jgi:hypothetical protein